MLGFFRKHQAPPPPTPPWLRWGVLVFLGLAILANALGYRPQSAERAGQRPSDFRSLDLYSLDKFKSRLIPGYGKMRIQEVKEGTGAEAACGQDVTIKFRSFLIDNYDEAKPDKALMGKTPMTAEEREAARKEQQKKEDAQQIPPDIVMEERKLRLGSDQLPGALQQPIIGMKIGGVRKVFLPKQDNEDGQRRIAEYELVSVSPEFEPAPEGAMPLKSILTRAGAAHDVRCGEVVKAHLKLWDGSGKLLLNSRETLKEPIPIEVGGGFFMRGLEEGMMGMQSDGARTLIIPPHLQKPLRNAEHFPVQGAEILHKLALPDNLVIIADVELVK